MTRAWPGWRRRSGREPERGRRTPRSRKRRRGPGDLLAKDPRFSTTAARVKPENEQVLREEIEAWSIHLTAGEILEKVLSDPGPGMVVFGRVESPTEVLSRENWWERGCFQRIVDPVYGPLTLQMPVWRMTGTPPRLRWPCRPVGHHNEHVYLKYLGLGRTRLRELHARGIL